MAMENQVNLQCNKIIHLENSMVMYDDHNLDILEKLITTVHGMHNSTTWNEKLSVSKLDSWYNWHLPKDEIDHYAINYLLFLRTLR